MRCGKSSCNLLIILKKSYLLKKFVHYIKKMLNFHSLYSDCVWYKKLRELACVHYIANFTILQFVITKFVCTNKSQKYHYSHTNLATLQIFIMLVTTLTFWYQTTVLQGHPHQ